ncbi:hypothetical protein Trydic_g4922 [Trypoxylus dichotomus]
MADNEDDLQQLLYCFQSKAESLNMQVFVEKAESTVIAKEPVRLETLADNKGEEHDESRGDEGIKDYRGSESEGPDSKQNDRRSLNSRYSTV